MRIIIKQIEWIHYVPEEKRRIKHNIEHRHYIFCVCLFKTNHYGDSQHENNFRSISTFFPCFFSLSNSNQKMRRIEVNLLFLSHTSFTSLNAFRNWSKSICFRKMVDAVGCWFKIATNKMTIMLWLACIILMLFTAAYDIKEKREREREMWLDDKILDDKIKLACLFIYGCYSIALCTAVQEFTTHHIWCEEVIFIVHRDDTMQ